MRTSNSLFEVVAPLARYALPVGDAQIILYLRVFEWQRIKCINTQGLVVIGDGLLQVVALLARYALRIGGG